MSVVALVEPASLLGQSLRQGLEAQSDVDLRLVGGDADEYGTLTRLRDEVVVVRPPTSDSLAGADLAVLCGGTSRQHEALTLLPAETPVIVVASDFDHPPGSLRVAGVNDGADLPGHVTVSPHPAIILLARLLSALAEHQPLRASATVLLPASNREGPGLEELFEQARSILNFSDDQPQAVFGRQLVFNLLPLPPANALGDQVRQVIGSEVEIGSQLLQSSVFHGLAGSVMIEMAESTSVEQVMQSLRRGPSLEIADAPQGLGPIDVAGREEILVGQVVPDPRRPNVIWLWAMIDSLAGGAANALELALSTLQRGAAD